MEAPPEAWAVETSKDGERWRFYGKAWKWPEERVLLHAAPRFVRFRQIAPVEQSEWCEPLEGDGDTPMTLLGMERREREDLGPGQEHLGLPVLLPGGEAGRLLRFERGGDGRTWTYALEFRGP
ncbi:MAG: hypothetical protein ACM3WR_00950 [Solirubrobacterales bacterium]